MRRLLLTLLIGAAASVSAQTSTEIFSPPGPIGDDLALKKYVSLLGDLKQKGQLPNNEMGGYTSPATRESWSDYRNWTASSVPWMLTLRNLPPEADKNPVQYRQYVEKGFLMLYAYNPGVFVFKDGTGFISRRTPTPTIGDLIVYDSNNGGYKQGEEIRPYVTSMLTSMDVSALPKVGRERTSFLVFTSPSCPYSKKIQPHLEASGLSFRMLPSYYVDPRKDFQRVVQMMCSADKLGTLKRFWADPSYDPNVESPNSTCQDTSAMQMFVRKDLEFLYGFRVTPSYLFPDGTVIEGGDKNMVDAVKKKAAQLAAANIYFR